MIFRLLKISVCLWLFAQSVYAAESITVIVTDTPIQVDNPDNAAFEVQPELYSPVPAVRDVVETHITHPDFSRYDKYVEESLVIKMIAGADYRCPMQYRVAELPMPFPEGYWPTAVFRSAKSPSGVILATYTITIDDEAQVKWSLRLSAAQTAALAGKTGITEMSIPYAPNVYHILSWSPTSVAQSVTRP